MRRGTRARQPWRVRYPVLGAASKTQVAVVGAGAAGLYTALRGRARAARRVMLVSATPLAESSSYWAQGGLAAAMAADDSPELHLADTIAAGRGRGARVRGARAVRGGSRRGRATRERLA